MLAIVFMMALMVQIALHAQTAAKADAKVVIAEFDAPFTFSFLSWKDKLSVVDGHAVLKDLKCDGGAGVKVKLDLSRQASKSPALKLRTKSGNTAKTIKFSLMDAEERTGRWEFPLPKASDDFVIVTPKGGVSLSKPNTLENKKSPDNPGVLDLAHLMQYQVIGDWSKDTLDVEIDAIVLVEADAELLAQREAYAKQEAEEAALKAKKDAEEKARLTREREDKIKRYSVRSERSPEVAHVSLVAPEILSLTIEAQRIVPPVMSKYEPQEGDELKVENRVEKSDRTVKLATLKRGGKLIGYVQGRNREWLTTFEKVEGEPLLDFTADNAANYTIASTDDPAYATPVKPVAVYRKSVPSDALLSGGAFPVRHRIYLKMPTKIEAGKNYSIAIDTVNVRNPNLSFKADLQNVRSEAVHVNQIGYRPDDPSKRAFLSVWLGTGGACKYPEGLKFSLVDEATQKPAFTGNVEKILDVDGKEEFWVKPPKNYSQTAVYRMDFSAFKAPGHYRMYVEGIGCSYPFEIGQAVWEKAFLVQMKGLYNQRSGIELGPPYSDFRKPRDFHPDDGAVVTRTAYDALSKGGEHAYGDIAKGDTGEAVKNAWGGYHDAGDWNPRRVTHMQTTLAQLELVEMYPAYFNSLNLNIPKMEGVPDIITEALFEIDCFRRLQLPDGAMPYGIETNGDPLPGELSWLSSQPAYVLAPNIRDSWFYAAVAGRAAKVLKPIKPELAKVYEDSAVKAFAWAESSYAKMEAKATWDSVDARNLSAVILYDLTGDKAYHDIFLQTTCMKDAKADVYIHGRNIQSHAAFAYARLAADKTDPKMKENALAAILTMADRSLQYGSGNAFNVTNRERGRPMFAGFFGTPGGTELVRAHYLTGKNEYLKGALQSCQFPSGCNPNNIVYTTGVGANPVKHPLHVDSRYSGQPVPVGLNIWGNVDYWNWKGFWEMNLQFLNKPEYLWPNAYEWPLTEAYYDVWLYVPCNEFVVDTWGTNVFVWGYLTARPIEKGPSPVENR